MNLFLGNDELLQVLNACQMPLVWLAIALVSIFAIVFIVYKIFNTKKDLKGLDKDIHNIDEWSKTANNAILLEACQDPNVEANFQKLQTYINDVVAKQLEHLMEKDSINEKLTGKIENLTEALKNRKRFHK